ncbi:MAG: DUF4158 domain-containing protein [Opitutaceae bacterium]|nr:DUF4158 domain-containing protein [Cytophagales bacterium]
MAVTFLTSLERLRYEQIPSSVSEEEISIYFQLSAQDLELVEVQRGKENRIAFALQLCIIRFIGYLPDNWQTTVPEKTREIIGQQLMIDKSFLKNYGTRAATKTEHLHVILKYIGFSKWAPLDNVPLETWLLERAMEHDKPTLLLDLACEKLVTQNILRPSIGIVLPGQNGQLILMLDFFYTRLV